MTKEDVRTVLNEFAAMWREVMAKKPSTELRRIVETGQCGCVYAAEELEKRGEGSPR